MTQTMQTMLEIERIVARLKLNDEQLLHEISILHRQVAVLIDTTIAQRRQIEKLTQAERAATQIGFRRAIEVLQAADRVATVGQQVHQGYLRQEERDA